MEIIPAILEYEEEGYGKLVRKVLESNKYNRVHVDLIDESYGRETVEISKTTPFEYRPLEFDIHLMVHNNLMQENIKKARRMGYKRIIAQVESVYSQMDFLGEVSGYKCGLALDLDSGVEEIDDRVLPYIDTLILMSVPAGYGNQVFQNRVLEKIRHFSVLRSNMDLDFKICVDGGIDKIHLDYLDECGADEVVVGGLRVLSWSK